jgi:carboxypeptidase C (cathepsin A)
MGIFLLGGLLGLLPWLPLAPAAPAGDRILSLPGWPGALPSPQYSGYLDLPGGRKHLHYWFIGSEGADAAAAPVTVWLNGGPGCSSLDGLVYEHGPFRFDAADPTKLVRFNYTWAKRSNLLYLEAPVGVGFSYSDDPADYNCTDDTTALDNLHAVEQFYALFPEFKANDLFLTGESYAGVYVPTLAEAIVQAIEAGTYTGAPLKGIAVGNGCTGTKIGVCGGARTKYDAEFFAKSTAMLGPTLQAEIMENCDWSRPQTISTACQQSVDKMGPLLDRINLYNVYGECISGDSGSGNVRHKAPVSHLKNLISVDAEGARVRGPDACIDSIEASNYINQAALQKAIHVKPIAYRWKTCGSVPGWQYTSTRENLPRDTYPLLIQHMRVVIYNGDWDACVPWTDNQAWTRDMGYPAKDPWHPWTFDNLDDTGVQVGGYAINYQVPAGAHNFTFITVRGGRHEVPETAPKRAFSMFSRLIADETF